MVDIGDTVTDFSEFDESFLMRHAFDNNRKDSSDQLTKKVELPKPQYVNGYRGKILFEFCKYQPSRNPII